MNHNCCVHYNGTRGDEPICRIGIDVRAKFKPCWPCWTGNKLPDSSALCDSFQEPTPEQIAEWKWAADIQVEKMLTALVAIEAWEKTVPKGKQELNGQIDCPCCQAYGALLILITPRHLYATCKTDGCVKFRGSRRR